MPNWQKRPAFLLTLLPLLRFVCNVYFKKTSLIYRISLTLLSFNALVVSSGNSYWQLHWFLALELKVFLFSQCMLDVLPEDSGIAEVSKHLISYKDITKDQSLTAEHSSADVDASNHEESEDVKKDSQDEAWSGCIHLHVIDAHKAWLNMSHVCYVLLLWPNVFIKIKLLPCCDHFCNVEDWEQAFLLSLTNFLCFWVESNDCLWAVYWVCSRLCFQYIVFKWSNW